MTNICTLCLARWPLPALADGCALHTTRTKVLLQSDQKTLQKSDAGFSGVCSASTKGWHPMQSDQPCKAEGLLEFDLGASFFQFLLGGFCICFGRAFFDGFGCAVDQVFGFFQAQAGDFAHGLDD